ncbi:MAG: response regulator [Geobacteraceae bacterium]|nr:response regulator [Geobacteraceae bacterium]
MNNRGTILVVDDTPEALRVLAGILQPEGYRVRPANSGELALASIAAQHPDLILLDIRMPGMDGFEVCRRLKADEGTSHIPVIFQSAATELAERLEGLRLGAVDYISKPFQREELLARVRTHLELAQLRGDLEKLVNERTLQLEVEIVERRRAEEDLRLNLDRQRALLEVYRKMPTSSVQETISLVVDKCVHMTGSAIGFVGLISDDDQRMEAHIFSEKVMENCPLDNPLDFSLRDAGLWAEPARQSRMIIVNDYGAPNPLKKGYPAGHFELVRFMGVPVVDNGRVAAVAGVANSMEDYAEADQYTISLLLEGMWEIIKRKLAEERLKDNEARYRALFEGVPDAILIADIATGIIRNVNPSACRLFARTRDELVGAHQATLHPPRLARETKQSFREHAYLAEKGKPGAPFEHAILRADGSEIPIEISTQPVLLGEEKMILGVFRDISERKRAEEALRMLNSELEERVKERTAELAAKNAELERANRLFVGRELRMVELKKRIREMEKGENK